MLERLILSRVNFTAKCKDPDVEDGEGGSAGQIWEIKDSSMVPVINPGAPRKDSINRAARSTSDPNSLCVILRLTLKTSGVGSSSKL